MVILNCQTELHLESYTFKIYFTLIVMYCRYILIIAAVTFKNIVRNYSPCRECEHTFKQEPTIML